MTNRKFYQNQALASDFLQQQEEMLRCSREDLLAYVQEEVQQNPLIQLDSLYSLRQAPLLDFALAGSVKDLENPAASLWESLEHQALCYRDTPLRDLVIRLIPLVDEKGYLRESHGVLCAKLACQPVELEDAIVLLQQLEPAGVGARDLRECWMLQTEQDEEAPDVAYLILEECFGDLAARRFTAIAEKLAISMEQVEESLRYYQRLSSSPGLDQKEMGHNAFPMPDCYLRREQNGRDFSLYYNEQYLPNLSFNQTYYEELSQSSDEEVLTYIANMKRNYQQLASALKRRKQILLLLSQLLVQEQQEFFLSKGYKKKELNMKTLASLAGLQFETVQAALTGKTLYTDFASFSYEELLSEE